MANDKHTAPLQSQFSRLTRVMAAFTASLFLVSSQLALPAQANELARAARADMSRQEWRQFRQDNRLNLRIPESQGPTTGTVTITPGVIPNPTLGVLTIPNTKHPLNPGRHGGGGGGRHNDGNDRAQNKAQRAGVRAERVQAHQAHVNAVRADRLSNFVIQENAGQIIRLDNGANLDLTASNSDITIGDKLIADGGFVTIKEGGTTKNIYAGSKVTAAEYVAVKQAIAGNQSLVVDSNGKATGGTVDLNTIAATKNTMKATSLTVGSGVTAIGDLDKHSSFKLDGDLNNFGSIYAVNTQGNHRGTADIAADNITNNEGALISSNAGSQFGNKASTIDLSLSANNNFSNKGTIESSGDLSISAGNSISNGSGSHITANSNLNLSSKTIANAGTISSTTRDITVDAPVGADLNVDNNGGTLQALQGAINVRAPNYNGTNNSTITGGDLLSQQVNMHTGQGTTDINVGQLTGTVTGTGTAAHVEASTDTLTIGKTCLTGDPTYKNNAGNIQITGDIVVGEALAILAAGNVTATNGLTQIVARTAGGVGQSILITAGYAQAGGGGGGTNNPTLPASTFPPATGGVPANSAVTLTTGGTGGDVDLSGAAANLQILANATSIGDGASVQIMARSEAGVGGRVILPTGSLINTSGNGFGARNGAITVFGGSNQPGANTIQLGSLLADGGINTLGGSGNITVNNNNPNVPVAGVVVATNGAITSGTFTSGTAQTAAGITIGGGGAGSVVASHGNISIGGQGGGATVNAADIHTHGGNINVTATGTGDSTLTNTDAAGNVVVLTEGGNVSVTAQNGAARLLSGNLSGVQTSFGAGGGNVNFSGGGGSSVNANVVTGGGSATFSSNLGTQVAGSITTNGGAVQLLAAGGNVKALGVIDSSGGAGGAVTLTGNAGLTLQANDIITGGGAVTITGGSSILNLIDASNGSVGGNVSINTSGGNKNVQLNDNILGGVLTLNAGTGSFNAPDGEVFTVNDLTLSSSLVVGGGTGALTITTLNPAGQIGIGGPGAGTLTLAQTELNRIQASTLNVGDATATGGIILAGPLDVSGTGPGQFNLNFLNGGNFDQNGQSITLGDKNLFITVGGNIQLSDISSTTGNITGNATGDSLGFFAGADITTTTGDVSLTSAGSIGTGIFSVTSTSGDIALIANGGNVLAGDLTTGGAGTINVFANGPNSIAVLGDLTTNTGSISVATNDSIFTGDISTNGGILSLGTLNNIITGDISGIGNAAGLILSVAGDISVGDVTLTGATQDIMLTAGNDIFIGDLATTGAGRVIQLVAGTLNPDHGDIEGGGVSSLTTTNGNILLSSADDIDIGDIDTNGGALTIMATAGTALLEDVIIGDITGISNSLTINAGRNGGAIDIGNVLLNFAAQNIALTSDGDVFAGDLSANGAGGTIDINALDQVAVGNLTTTTGDITIDAGSSTDTGFISTTTGNVSINTGNFLSINGDINSGSGNVTLGSTLGPVFTDSIITGGRITINSGGDIDTLGGILFAGGRVLLNAGGDTTTDDITSGGANGISITSGGNTDTDQGTLSTTTGNIVISSGNNTRTDDINAGGGGLISISSGNNTNGTNGTYTTALGGTVDITSGGDTTNMAIATASGSVTILSTGNTDINNVNSTAGGNIQITSTFGDTTTGDMSTTNTGFIDVSSGGNTNVGVIVKTGGNGRVQLTSGGDTDVVSITASGAARIEIDSAGFTDVAGAISKTGNGFIAISSGQDTTLNGLVSSTTGNITLGSGNNTIINNITTSGGSVTINSGADTDGLILGNSNISTGAGDINVTSGQSTGLVSVNTTTGNINIVSNGLDSVVGFLGSVVSRDVTSGSGNIFIDSTVGATSVGFDLTTPTILYNVSTGGAGTITINSAGSAAGLFGTLTGNLSTDTGNITLTATADGTGTGNITTNSGDVVINSADNVQIGFVPLTGNVSLNTGNLTVNADTTIQVNGNVGGTTSDVTLTAGTDITVNNIVLTGVGSDIHMNAGGNITTLGVVQADPVTMLSGGTISLGGNVVADNGIVLVAGQDITTSTSVAINGTSTTGNAGDITMIAGANFTDNGTSVTINGNSGTGGSITGNISAINSNSTFAGGSGGDVTLLAFNNAGSGGTINIPSANILTSGQGTTGVSGNAVFVAGNTAGGAAITVGNINTTTSSNGANGSGDVALVSSVPTGGFSVDTNTAVGTIAGTVLGNPLTVNDVNTGNIRAAGADVFVSSGQNASLGTVNVSSTADAGADAGSIFIFTNGSVPFTIGAASPNGALSLLADGAGGGGVHAGGLIVVNETSTNGIVVNGSSISATTPNGAGGVVSLISGGGTGDISLNGATINASGGGIFGAGGAVILTGNNLNLGGANSTIAVGGGTSLATGGDIIINMGGGAAINIGTGAAQLHLVDQGDSNQIQITNGGNVNIASTGSFAADDVSIATITGDITSQTGGNISAINMVLNAQGGQISMNGNVNGTLTLTATANGDVTGTGTYSGGTVDLDSATGNVSGPGNTLLNVDAVNLTANAAANVLLNALNGVNFVGLSSAGNTFTVVANNDITGSAGHLLSSGANMALTSNNGNIGVDAANRLNVSVATVLDASAPNGSVFIHGVGDLLLGVGNAGGAFNVLADNNLGTNGPITANNINLRAQGGALNIIGALNAGNTIRLRSAASITNASINSQTLTATNVILTSDNGNIGQSITDPDQITVDATNVTANAAGLIHIHSVGSVNLVGDWNAGSIIGFQANSGNMVISGNLTANDILTQQPGGSLTISGTLTAANTVFLNTNGNQNTTGAGLVTANTVLLNTDYAGLPFPTVGSTGSAGNRFMIDANNLVARSGNSVFITDVAGGINLIVGPSSGLPSQAANTFDLLATTGDITSSVGGSITAADVILTAVAGGVQLGAAVNGSNSITVNSFNSILQGNLNNNLNATTIALTSTNGSIGAGPGARVQLATANLTANAADDVYIFNNGNLVLGPGKSGAGAGDTFDVSVNGTLTVSGAIDPAVIVLTSTGDLNIASAITATVSISATSTAGNIFKTAAAGNLVAPLITLSAVAGNIGANPGARVTIDADNLVANASNVFLSDSDDVNVSGASGATGGFFLLDSVGNLSNTAAITANGGGAIIALQSTGGSIDLHADVTALSGNVNLQASGDVNNDAGTAVNSQTAQITSLNGDIGGAGNRFNVNVSNGLTVTANSGGADAFVHGIGSLVLGSSSAAHELNVHADNDLTLGFLSIQSANIINFRAVGGGLDLDGATLLGSNRINLRSNDSILSSSINSAIITTPQLNLTSDAGDIILSGANLSAVPSLTANAAGDVNITTTNGINIGPGASSAGGDFSIATGNNGNLSVTGTINATNVSLDSDGSVSIQNAVTGTTSIAIEADNSISNADLAGGLFTTNLSLRSNFGDIGAAGNRVQVDTVNLSVNTPNGSVFVRDTNGGVNLGGLFFGGSNADGDLNISSNGFLTTSSAVSTNNGDVTFISSNGLISVGASVNAGADFNATAQNNFNNVANNGFITADQNVNITAGSITLNENVTATNGGITLTANNAITTLGAPFGGGAVLSASTTVTGTGSNITLGDDVTTTNGDISFVATNNLTVGQFSSINSGNDITLTATGGALSVTAGFGGMNADRNITLTANTTATLNDGFGITAGNDLTVAGGSVVSNENLNAGNDVIIVSANTVNINNTVNADRDIQIGAIGNVNTGIGGTLDAGRDVAIGSFGDIVIGDDINANNNVAMAAVNISSTSIASIFGVNNVNLQATTGAFDLDGGVVSNTQIDLRSNLSITNANVSGGLTAPQINLTTDTGNIGSSNISRLALDFDSVSATATAGNVWLSDTSGTLNIGGAPSSAAGFFDVLAVGDITTSDAIAGGAVIIRSTGGSFTNNSTIGGFLSVDLRAATSVSINDDVSAIAGGNTVTVRADNSFLVLNGDVTGDVVSLRSGTNMTSPLGTAIGNTSVTLLSDNGDIGVDAANPFFVDTTSITANAPNGSAWVRDISTAGTINIQQSNAQDTLSFVGTNNVNVAGQLTGTDINVQSTDTFFFINANVVASNSVTLQSRFGISDANFFSLTSIQAPLTNLITDQGDIGAIGDTLDLNLTAVNFSAPNGSVYFFDPTALVVNGATTNALGDVDITANGALSTTAAITSGNVFLTSNNSSLTIGGNINANFAADLEARNDLTTTGGAVVTAFDVTLLSTTGNVGLTGNHFAVEANNITANAPQGSVFIDANFTSLAAANLTGASSALSTFTLNTGGNLTQDLGSTVTALNINLNSGGSFILGGTFTAGNTINATSVDSIFATGVGPTTFTATQLNLTSITGDIGLNAGNRLVIDADNLTANAANGNVFIDGGAGTMNIGLGTSQALFAFDVTAGTLSTSGAITANDVTLASTVGGISIDANVTGNNSVTLNSATSLLQTGGTISGGDLSVTYTTGNTVLTSAVDSLTTNAAGTNFSLNNAGTLTLLSQNVNDLTVSNVGTINTGANISVTGDLSLNTFITGSINLNNNITAGGDVILHSSGLFGTRTITQAGGTTITGQLLDLAWVTGNVNLVSAVTGITADAPGRNLTLTNTGDIAIGALNLANFTLIANSDITVNTPISLTNVLLQANTGNIILNADVNGTSTVTLRAFQTITQNSGLITGGALTLSYNLGAPVLDTDVTSLAVVAVTAGPTFDPAGTSLTINEGSAINVLNVALDTGSFTVNAFGNVDIQGTVDADTLASFSSGAGNITQSGGSIFTGDLRLTSNGTIGINSTYNDNGSTQEITVTGTSVANVATQEFGTVILNGSSATSLFLDASGSTEVTTAGNTTVSQFLDITTPRLNNQFALSAGNILSVQSGSGDLIIDGGAGSGSLTAGTSIDLTATSGDLIFFGNQNFFGVANLFSNPNPPFGSIVISTGANVVGDSAVNLNTCSLILDGILVGNPINYLCPTGGGTIANSVGNVVLTSDINFFGKNFAIIASGSIIASGINNINLSSGVGDGGTLTMLAGFDFTPGTGGQLNNTPILFTVNGPSVTGGNVQMSGVNIDVSSTAGNGGGVFVAAVDGAVFNGDVTLGQISTSSTSNFGGTVTVLAGGDLTLNGGINTTGNIAGNVNLQVTNPQVFGGNVYVANGDVFGPGFIDGSGIGADGNININNTINAGNGSVNVLGAAGALDSIVQNNGVLIADTLNINAGSGDVNFGSGTQVNFLNSDAAGSVYVSNSSFLTLVSVTGTSQDFHVDNSGGILSNSTINVNSVQIHEFTTNGIAVTGDITTVGDLNLTGFGGGDVSLISGATLTTTGGGNVTIEADFSGTANAFVAGDVTSSGSVSIFGGNNTTINGVIQATDNVTANAGTLVTVNNTITTTNGDISSTGSTVDVNAALNAGNNVVLSATNNVDTDAVTAGNNITLSSVNGTVTVGGVMNATNNVLASSTNGNVDINNSVTATNGNIDVSAGTTIDVDAVLNAGNDVSFTTSNGDVNVNFSVVAANNVTASANGTGDVNVNASLTATNGTIDLGSENDVNVGGTLNAGNNVNLFSNNGDINISATITAANDVTGQANNLGDINVNAAVTATNGLIDLSADGDLTTTAVLNAGDTLDLTTNNGDINIGANVLAANGATLNSGADINFTASSVIDGGSSVQLFAGAGLINGGALVDITLFADNLVTANTDISTTGNVLVQGFLAGSQIGLGDVSGFNVTLNADTVSVQDVTTTNDANIFSLAFTTGGDITAGNNVNITTNALTNTGFTISGDNVFVGTIGGASLTVNGGAGGTITANSGSVNFTSTAGDITFTGAQTFNGTTQITPGGPGFSVIVANGANVLGNNDVFLNTCSLILQGNGTINGNLLHFNCPEGAGTIANASGDVDLSGINLVFDGKSLAILASGNIIGGSTSLIDLSSSTGDGGNLFAVAGFDFTPGTGGVQVNLPNDVLYTLAQGGGNTGGGKIDFSTLDIITNGIGSGNGGDVTLVAHAGNVNDGTVTFNNITTTGGISGNDGNVLVIAEGGFLQLGTITNPGGTTTLAAATPTIVGGPIMVGNGENLGPGTFSFGPPTAAGTIANSNGDVDLTGLNLTFVGLNLAIIASGDVLAGTNTTINLSNPAGNGGTLLVVAGFDFTPATAGQVNFNAGTTYTFGSGSSTGGDIDFTGLTITTSATGGNAGDVTLVAKAGGTNSGSIVTGNINAVGTGGAGGDVLLIAEGGFVIGGIANTGTTVNGSQTLAAATPLITGGPITVNNGTQGGAGAFTFTAPTGAGTIANSAGDVSISGTLNFTGLSLAILASGSINGAGATIDLSNNAGIAGNLTMVAGFDFTPATVGQVTDTVNVFTLTGPNANGGNINMSGANITTSGSTAAGDVIAIANGGTVNTGTVTLGNIGASSANVAGDVQIIGEGGITVGAIVNTGATGGDVTLQVAQPTIVGTVTVQNGNLLTGSFTNGAATTGNITVASIDAGNNVIIAANTGGAGVLTVGNIQSDADMTISNTGSVTVSGNLLSDLGAINITANDVVGSATVMTINAGVNITADTAINIINNGTEKKLDFFNIGAGATIATTSIGAKDPNEGDITLRMGPVSTPISNKLPQARFTVTETGGTVNLFGRKPKGSKPVNNLTAIGADMFITNGLGGKNFTFGGGVTVQADPPVAAGTPTYVNGRLVGGERGNNGHAQATTAIEEMTAALNSNLVSGNNLGQVETNGNLLSSTVTGTDTLATGNSLTAATLTAGTAGTTTPRTETLFGAVSQVNEAEDNSYMVSSSTGPVKEAEASICSDADLGTAGNANHIAHNDRVVLKQGNVLFVPFRNTVVETPQGNVLIEAKSVALVSVSNDKLAVYDIDDSHKGAVAIEAQGQKVTLAPGNHLTIASAKSGEFAQVNAIEAIPHRNVATKVINNGVKLHTSEFSVASAMQSIKPLQAVMSSKHPQAKKVADRMMKTTAVLLTLGGKGEFQHFFKPALTAMK